MMIVVLTGNLIVSSLNYDMANSWNRYAATFPVRRSRLVSVKFATLYLLMAAETVLMLLAGIPFSWYMQAPYVEYAAASLACIIVGLFAMSLNLLLCTKFGVRRAQIVSMLSYMAPFGCVGLLYYLSERGTIDLSHVTGKQVYLAIFGLGAAAVALSLLFWRLSCRIFQKQDL